MLPANPALLRPPLFDLTTAGFGGGNHVRILPGGRMSRLTQALAACSALLYAHAAQGQTPALASETINVHSIGQKGSIQVPVDLVFPRGAGPFPAMVIAHGSGGVSKQNEYRYAAILSAMGVASAIPDGYKARGVKDTIMNQGDVEASELADDAMRILAALVKHPKIDPARIGVMGFSKGGIVSLYTAIESWADRVLPGGPRFALHIPFYPSCTNQYFVRKSTGAPVLMLLGSRDRWAAAPACIDYAATFVSAGANMQAITYKSASHAWDTARVGENVLPNADMYFNCLYREQADGSWIDLNMGHKVRETSGVATRNGYTLSISKCRTKGTSYRGDLFISAIATTDALTKISEVFGLAPVGPAYPEARLVSEPIVNAIRLKGFDSAAVASADTPDTRFSGSYAGRVSCEATPLAAAFSVNPDLEFSNGQASWMASLGTGTRGFKATAYTDGRVYMIGDIGPDGLIPHETPAINRPAVRFSIQLHASIEGNSIRGGGYWGTNFCRINLSRIG